MEENARTKLAVLTAVLVASTMVLYWRTADGRSLVQEGPGAEGKPLTQSNQSHKPSAQRDSTVIQYGVLKLENTGEITTIPIPHGQRIHYEPWFPIDFDIYVDGRKWKSWKSGHCHELFAINPSNVTSVGFALTDTRYEKVPMAFVRYKGAKPPENWIEKAMAQDKVEESLSIK